MLGLSGMQCVSLYRRAACTFDTEKDGIIELYFPASRFLPEKDQGAAFLLSRDPDAATEPLLAERLDGVFAVSL